VNRPAEEHVFTPYLGPDMVRERAAFDSRYIVRMDLPFAHLHSSVPLRKVTENRWPIE